MSNILSQHEVLFIKEPYALKNLLSPFLNFIVIARLRGMVKFNNSDCKLTLHEF